VSKGDYRVLCCEGGDQVGKGDAILNLSERLLSEGFSVTYSSFPIYATPWGALVRYSLKTGLEDFSFSSDIEELKVRLSLLAINRLEFMEVLLSNPIYKDTIILLDRSSFSNAVTLGYGLATMGRLLGSEGVGNLVDYALNLEDFMIKKMNLKNCVVQFVTEEEKWGNVRKKKGDLFETKDVQEALRETYDIYQGKIGQGWKKILTKTEGGWRSREEISEEMYDFLLERIGDLNTGKEVKKMYSIRYEIGIEEILGSVYKGEELPSGILTKYLKALRGNDKDTMYKYGSLIGIGVGKTCQLIKFKNKGVRRAIAKIIDGNPGVMDVVSRVMSQSFADKFVKAIDE
jgi:thymidylate kinase